MSRRLRFVILWLLALALPMQGMASALMVHCGTSHQRMQLHTQAHTPHVGSEHVHPVLAQDHHAAPGDTAHDTTSKVSCSACAVCCSVCALPSSVLKFAAPEPCTTVFDALVPTVEPFAAEGPERPPRRLMA